MSFPRGARDAKTFSVYSEPIKSLWCQLFWFFYRNQNVYLNQNGLQFRLRYVRGPLIQWRLASRVHNDKGQGKT